MSTNEYAWLFTLSVIVTTALCLMGGFVAVLIDLVRRGRPDIEDTPGTLPPPNTRSQRPTDNPFAD